MFLRQVLFRLGERRGALGRRGEDQRRESGADKTLQCLLRNDQSLLPTKFAGVTIPNDENDLGSWIVDSQHFKPGNQMPDINLNGPQLQALLAYLESLK